MTTSKNISDNLTELWMSADTEWEKYLFDQEGDATQYEALNQMKNINITN